MESMPATRFPFCSVPTQAIQTLSVDGTMLTSTRDIHGRLIRLGQALGFDVTTVGRPDSARCPAARNPRGPCTTASVAFLWRRPPLHMLGEKLRSMPKSVLIEKQKAAAAEAMKALGRIEGAVQPGKSTLEVLIFAAGAKLDGPPADFRIAVPER